MHPPFVLRFCFHVLCQMCLDLFAATLIFVLLIMPTKVPTFRPVWQKARAEVKREYESSAERREDKAFYMSPRWLRLRKAKLSADPTCAECKRQGRLALATHVHHIKERKDHPELALDWDNLMSLCGSCHSRLHARQKRS